MINHIKNTVFFTLVLAIISGINIYNEYDQKSEWQSTYWADQGGYYFYLPLLFNYQLDVQSIPEDLDNKYGEGFHVDHGNNTVTNIYPCGVALLQTPFFISASIYYYYNHQKVTGFEKGFQNASIIGLSFYLLLGFDF
jgi:hypothetical protein